MFQYKETGELYNSSVQLIDTAVPITYKLHKQWWNLIRDYSEIKEDFEAILFTGKESFNYISIPYGRYEISSEEECKKIKSLVGLRTGSELGFSLRIEMNYRSGEILIANGVNISNTTHPRAVLIMTIGELNE